MRNISYPYNRHRGIARCVALASRNCLFPTVMDIAESPLVSHCDGYRGKFPGIMCRVASFLLWLALQNRSFPTVRCTRHVSYCDGNRGFARFLPWGALRHVSCRAWSTSRNHCFLSWRTTRNRCLPQDGHRGIVNCYSDWHCWIARFLPSSRNSYLTFVEPLRGSRLDRQARISKHFLIVRYRRG